VLVIIVWLKYMYMHQLKIFLHFIICKPVRFVNFTHYTDVNTTVKSSASLLVYVFIMLVSPVQTAEPTIEMPFGGRVAWAAQATIYIRWVILCSALMLPLLKQLVK